MTGATSGIGATVSWKLARLGWSVLVHGRDRDRTNTLAQSIAKRSGVAVRPYVADFESFADLRDMIDEIRSNEQKLDLLVNNAGTGFEPPGRLSRDGVEPVLQTNFIAPVILMQALRPLLHGSPRACIINIGSIGQASIAKLDFEHRAKKRAIVYGQSKRALLAASRYLQPGFECDGIKIVYANPGSMIQTNLSARLIRDCPRIIQLILKHQINRAPDLDSVGNFIISLSETSYRTGVLTFLASNGRRPSIHRQVLDNLIIEPLIARVNELVQRHIPLCTPISNSV